MAGHYDAFHPYTQQHDAGVHVNCRPATYKTRTVNGTGSVNACMLVQDVERLWPAARAKRS